MFRAYPHPFPILSPIRHPFSLDLPMFRAYPHPFPILSPIRHPDLHYFPLL
jgi:hypothetical protein